MSETNQLSKFAVKAMKKLESKKERKQAKLYVPSLEQEITIQSVTETEFYEAMGVDDNINKPDLADLHIIYKSVIEPNLKDVAKELKDQKVINEYIDVCDLFEIHERKTITDEVLKLSGILSSDNKVKMVMVEALKN